MFSGTENATKVFGTNSLIFFTAYLAVYRRVWPCMAVYGCVALCVDLLVWLYHLQYCGLISPFLAVMDPNSFGLVHKPRWPCKTLKDNNNIKSFVGPWNVCLKSTKKTMMFQISDLM